jgi:prepilin-type N-terminal cleavage/methylation domain-containing protein
MKMTSATGRKQSKGEIGRLKMNIRNSNGPALVERFETVEPSPTGFVLAALSRRRSGPDFGFHLSDFPRSAFTLVELLLVMTVMVVAMSICAPMLANFFRGRTLDSEARLLLALTHSGQNRAISEGIPTRLWIDSAQHAYGLQQDPGWSDRDPKAEEFPLDKDLRIEVLNANNPGSSSTRTKLPPSAQTKANPRNLPEIRFLPDGSIDETSPRALRLEDRNGTSLWLAQTTNRLSYEIRTEFN